MSRLFAAALSLWLALVSQSVQAMTLVRQGDDLFATGAIVETDFLAFKQALVAPLPKRLVLVNSPGGDLWTSLQVATMVRDAELDTLVSGACMSGCSMLFVAGKSRQFASGIKSRLTMIGIHGAHFRDTLQVNPQVGPSIFAFYKSRIGERFESSIINQAIYDIKDHSGFLLVPEIQRNRPAERQARFCASLIARVRDCMTHVGQDALTLGLVTKADTVEIQLPNALAPKIGYFGRQLPEPQSDLREHANQLINSLCDGFFCRQQAKSLMNDWMEQPDQRAFAVGMGKLGYGYAFGHADPTMAILDAMKRCNYAPGNFKLCKLVAVNDQEVYGFYAEAEQLARAQRSNLPEPNIQALAQERVEPGVSTPDALRTLDYDTMAPKQLSEVKRLDTDELARLLKSDKPSVMIDVSSHPAMLPGAVTFLNGGLAFQSDAQDASFDDRFRSMLSIAAPDKSQPVVFYCWGSQSWHSANAAMRARRAGYTQVLWYRGGLAAWQAAGMPVTSKVALAVIQ